MSQLGLGAVLQLLSSADPAVRKAYDNAIGKRIVAITLEGDAEDGIKFEFDDESTLRLYDAGRSCCKSRYMQCDDDLGAYVGAKFISAEVRDGGEVSEEEDDGDVTESQFLVIDTTAGSFTVASYNSHNGYYGGICLTASE